MMLPDGAVDWLLSDLLQNCFCCRPGISSLGDRPPYDDVAGASSNCFRWCNHTRLIAMVGSRRSHTGSHDAELVPKFCAQRGSLVRGSYQPLASNIKRDL